MSNEEKRFRKMIEDSQDWFWEFDENANFTYVSPRIRDLLGYEPEEVIGLNAFELMDAEEAERVRRHFDPIAKKFLPFKNLENINLHKDGHLVVIESSGSPIFDKEERFRGYRGIDRDITDRKVVEETLRQSQQHLAEIKQMARLGSWQLSYAQNRLIWSEQTFRIFGVKPQGFAATYEAFLETVHPEDRAVVDEAFACSVRNGQNDYEIEHRIIRQDTGEVRYVHEKCKHERDADGELVCSVGMVQDITERKAIEQALHSASQAAEAANRAKSLFLAKVSHEIRTPLTAIVGYGEMLEDAGLSPEHRKYLAAINNASHTLSSLINDILDLSKIDSGELLIKQEDIRLRSFIGKLADLQKEQIANKGLALDVSIGADVPDSLVGDPLRIQQILLNLLGNAVKFTENGSITLCAAPISTDHLRLEVIDTGIGIAADEIDGIFDPFNQARDGRSIDGTGLGLAINRSLIRLLGGEIFQVESEPGKGSRFGFQIPVQATATSVGPGTVSRTGAAPRQPQIVATSTPAEAAGGDLRAWPADLANETVRRIRTAIDLGDIASLFQLAEELARIRRFEPIHARPARRNELRSASSLSTKLCSREPRTRLTNSLMIRGRLDRQCR